MRYNADDPVTLDQWQKDFAEAREKLQHEQDMAQRAANIQAQAGQQYNLGIPIGLATLQGQLGKGQAQGMQPKRPAELPVAISVLNERVVMLMDRLVELEKRLTPVTRKHAQDGTGPAIQQQTKGYGSATELGSLIAQATGNIDTSINGILDLLDRLEI